MIRSGGDKAGLYIVKDKGQLSQLHSKVKHLYFTTSPHQSIDNDS